MSAITHMNRQFSGNTSKSGESVSETILDVLIFNMHKCSQLAKLDFASNVTKTMEMEYEFCFEVGFFLWL